MSYQIFKSFSDVKSALGFTSKPKEQNPKEEKEVKCRICGAPMKRVSGTNLIVCTGEVKTKEGDSKPCENYILMNHVNK